MKTLAFDLSCLPKDGSEGAGIPQATVGLWRAMQAEASFFQLVCKDSHECTREDAYFSPTGVIPWGRRGPAFAWVHDLAIFSHPEWFPESWLRRQYTTRRFLYGLRQASHVFCVSEETKRVVLERAGVPAEKTTVTLEGVDYPARVDSLEEREDIVVILGTVEPRKNIPFIVRLWPQIQARLPRPTRLMIAGKEGWGQVGIKAGKGIERLMRVSNKERDVLLEQAKLVLVPSLYEGFGRVALEAMAAGTPVIASRVGAHPEVVGEGGMLLDIGREEDWASAIERLLTDPKTWQNQQDAGRKRAQSFTWSATARRILAVIAKNC